MESLPDHLSVEVEDLCQFARHLYNKGYTEANGGNLSVRVRGNHLLTTPTMMSKGDLQPDDIVYCDMDGNVLYGKKRPSSELKTHIAIYKSREDINAVVHTHPPYCCSYAYTSDNPFLCLSAETEIWLDNVQIVDFIMPGSDELSNVIGSIACSTTNIMLRNHGIITYAPSLKEAVWKTDIMERQCMIMHLIESRGKSPVLIGNENKAKIAILKQKLT
ncbi:MAG: class II aldolase/adducin family protein [Bacteroidales bacterium]|nr:class II aldolase/adducin family protein [Bacteroidales bacterium]MDD4618226.1 class II aldolase/adducin family protein [Bacteroidales bacterium]